MAALYAATYPERTRALALFDPLVRWVWAEQETQEMLSNIRERWGTQEHADVTLREGGSSLYSNDEFRRWFANSLRVNMSPAVAYALHRAFAETDLSDVLPAIRVPALVLYRSNPSHEAPALDVAARIPSARAMRVSGSDSFNIFLSFDVVDELERFVAGEEAPFVPESVLATVMFTDLVASTERAAELGDRAWRELLVQHHALVRRELGRFRGEERDTAGDGFFATFDGPARAIRAGQAIIEGLAGLGLQARIGVHVGECELHEGKLPESRSTPARVSLRQAPARCWSQAPFEISSRGPGSPSTIEARDNSKASPECGSSTPPTMRRQSRTSLSRTYRCGGHGNAPGRPDPQRSAPPHR